MKKSKGKRAVRKPAAKVYGGPALGRKLLKHGPKAGIDHLRSGGFVEVKLEKGSLLVPPGCVVELGTAVKREVKDFEMVHGQRVPRGFIGGFYPVEPARLAKMVAATQRLNRAQSQIVENREVFGPLGRRVDLDEKRVLPGSYDAQILPAWITVGPLFEQAPSTYTPSALSGRVTRLYSRPAFA